MAEQEQVVLTVSGVSRYAGKQLLVSDISFNVRAGEVLALCGGNGAGKSTVLRMIAGITRPAEGEISIGGLTVKQDRGGYARQIGYMPDDFSFNPSLTARETLLFWAALRKIPGYKGRTEELLLLSGLQEKAKAKVGTFSKGMRQRLLFAQALLAKPPLLIMDEPTNGLDPYWMNELSERLLQLKAEGHAVIFSTHQLETAEAAADRILFLNGGLNVGEGKTADMVKRHGSLYCAFHDSLGMMK